MKKKLLAYIFIALLSLTAIVPIAHADPVVLKINNQEIRQSTIFQFMRIIAARQGEKNQQKLYNQAINDIIAQQLSYELAVIAKLDRNKSINQRIARLAKRSAEDIANYKKQMMIIRWQDQLPIPSTSEAAWQDAYQAFIKDRPTTMLYRISEIVVASEAEAISIIKQLKNGISFSRLAKQHSLDKSSAKKGGDLGYVSREQLPPSIGLVVESLKKNEFTNAPLKSDSGIHIIKLLAKKKGEPPPFEKSRNGLILIEKQKIARQKILERAKSSKIILIDENKKETPITFQNP
ncbi:MAG: peptidylprolyl isomerase [Alphaproteobacteria bacterium]